MNLKSTKKQIKVSPKLVTYLCYLLLIVLLLHVDIQSKMIMSKQEFILINDWLSLNLAINTGSAFSLAIPLIVTKTIGVVVAALLIAFPWLSKENLPWSRLALLAAITAGIIGNTIDRIFHGGVIDFISFSFWPNFNIADTYLTVGIISLLLLELFTSKPAKKTTKS